MKARIDAIIQREQAEYLENLHPANTGLFAEIESYAAEHRVPIADREVALFLEITARAIEARRVLECGMAIGYSVIHLARGMAEDGLVITIDPSDDMIKAAEGYLARAGVRERVRIEKGYALEVIPHLNEAFDLVFIDAVKEEYRGYLDLALPKLRKGGVVIVDNLLWGGQVAGEIRSPDQKERFISVRSRAFDVLAKRFWPGALTLIGQASPQVPDEVTADTGTIGVRLPDDDKVRALARACGGALTATSANPSGAEPARTAEEVASYFAAAVDLIVDGGQARIDRPSTVVDAAGPV